MLELSRELRGGQQERHRSAGGGGGLTQQGVQAAAGWQAARNRGRSRHGRPGSGGCTSNTGVSIEKEKVFGGPGAPDDCH